MSLNACILRLDTEIRQLQREPLPFIWVRPHEDDITKMDALVMGPPDTPYAAGFFHFELVFPNDYPHNPPAVRLLTTDNQRVRFNPNLYANGKVCLSILGTWAGPGWSSAESIASVLLSIQSLMNSEPYRNEPGFENERRSGDVKHYSDRIRHETLRVAVCDMVEQPTCTNVFRDVIETQFLLWFGMYLKIAKDQIAEFDTHPFRDPFGDMRGIFNYTSIVTRLEALRDQIDAKWTEQTEQMMADPESRFEMLKAIERLKDEFHSIAHDPPPGVSASPTEDNIWAWVATIFGPENSPWEGGIFSLELRFPYNYPERAPLVRFTSQIFHPNITLEGIPCVDILQGQWSRLFTVSGILVSLQSLLTDPNPNAPVNLEAATLYMKDRRQYIRRVRRCAQEG